MKIIVFPDGEVTFETEDVTQALAMVQGLRNGITAPGSKKSHHKKKSSQPVAPDKKLVPDKKLSRQSLATWNWLVANDRPSGVYVDEIAAGLNISRHAATWRLTNLIDKGLVHRKRRGYYRPGEAVTAPQEASEPSAESP
jgi:hypothetical protein